MEETRIDAFKANLDKQGYSHATRRWEPGYAMDQHSHDFSVKGLILSGSFTITTDSGPQTYSQGQSFAMAAGCPHSEVAGPEGVSFLVGRKD